jgi:two-component system OmpR family sensor kinase
MTRRRTFALMVLALVFVFVLGAIATIATTYGQLVDDVDQDLSEQIDITRQIYDRFSLDEIASLDAFEDLDVRASLVATVIVDPSGQVVLASPAGPTTDPLPLPDLPPERIEAGVEDHFTVDGTDGGPQHRVTVGRLDDGRLLALAAPLDNARDTIRGLSRTLFVTLVAMVTLLSVIIFFLLRSGFRPYEDLVATAESIADGEMDRRAVHTSADPEIRRLTDSLNTMLDRLQQSFDERQAAEERLRQFAADASHELRTPLATIAGYSEVYLSGAATDEASTRTQMTRINSEANRMGRLVNDLLTLTRLDQGRGLEFEPVDLRSLVDDAVADATVTDPTHRLRLVSDSDRPLTVTGDPDALRQVLSNLIDNTRVHAPAADVEVSVRELDSSTATVSVTDNGPGMSPDVADHVFDRYFRAGQPPMSNTRSSGLGLSIAAAIVAAHGGTIDLDTGIGEGSDFTIALPTTPMQPPSPPQGQAT